MQKAAHAASPVSAPAPRAAKEHGLGNMPVKSPRQLHRAIPAVGPQSSLAALRCTAAMPAHATCASHWAGGQQAWENELAGCSAGGWQQVGLWVGGNVGRHRRAGAQCIWACGCACPRGHMAMSAGSTAKAVDATQEAGVGSGVSAGVSADDEVDAGAGAGETPRVCARGRRSGAGAVCGRRCACAQSRGC